MVGVHFRIFRQELPHVPDYVASKTPELGSKTGQILFIKLPFPFFYLRPHNDIFPLFFVLQLSLSSSSTRIPFILSRGCHFITNRRLVIPLYITQQGEMKWHLLSPCIYFQIFPLFNLSYFPCVCCILTALPEKENCKMRHRDNLKARKHLFSRCHHYIRLYKVELEIPTAVHMHD